MKTAVIYARYSQGANQREESIEGQLRECTEYAEKNDIKIIGTYCDRKISGRTDNRTEFQRMLKDSEKQIFDTIIVWKIDRFGRNREEIAVNKIKLRKNGVTILYAKEHIPDGATGIILESLLEGLAEYYSAELSEKIVRGLTDNALKGKATNGSPGLGYKIGPDKKLVIDELEAPIIKQIFEMFAEGHTYTEIVNTLNEMGYKTKRGGSFNKSSLQRILKNEKYIGKSYWRDIELEIPAIISKDLYEQCQDKILRVTKAPGRGKAKMAYLLTGKLFCGHCGSNMVGESGTGKQGDKFYYYKCAAKKKDKNDCNKKTVRKAWVESLITKIIYNEVLSKDEVIEQIADAVMQIQKEESKGSLLASLEAQYSDVGRSIKNLIKLVEQGMMTKSTHSRLIELEEEQEDLAGRLAVERLTKADITKEHVVYWLRQLKELNLDELESQRKIIDAFLHSAFLFDDKIIITGNYTDDKGERREITLDNLENGGMIGVGEGSDLLLSSP